MPTIMKMDEGPRIFYEDCSGDDGIYFIGVDVGTGSVRAALVSSDGKVLETFEKATQTFNPFNDYYEQSSDDIWNACVDCIKNVTRDVEKEKIRGIGFDATCSLVALDKSGLPLSVSPTGKNEQNVILWLDHRAGSEAAQINQLNHEVLKYVGGKISLEMQTPKLLWLKNNLRDQCWNKAGYFFDLPDFLTWKATKVNVRSLCSLVCKWTYEIDSSGIKGWNQSYFNAIGLDDLVSDGFKKIGTQVFPPGTPIPGGLAADVAKDLGLLPGTPIGTSIIDAHAGGLGLIGCAADGIPTMFRTRLSLICGTSTCHMAVSQEPTFVPGVWGPYYSAMVSGMWLNEGGQSATGKLLDHIISTHPAYESILQKIEGNVHVQQYLSDLLIEMAHEKQLKSVAFLTKNVHIWPDFHGNRSPVADPTLKGMISGLTLATDERNLAVLYLSALQAISYGTRHILETLTKHGYSDIQSILICGGLSNNSFFTQTQADVVNLPVLCPKEKESVLLGGAILGACASGHFKDMSDAIRSMAGTGNVVRPNKEVQDYHNKKYAVFLRMLEHQREYKRIMDAEK